MTSPTKSESTQRGAVAEIGDGTGIACVCTLNNCCDAIARRAPVLISYRPGPGESETRIEEERRRKWPPVSISSYNRSEAPVAYRVRLPDAAQQPISDGPRRL